MHRLLVILCVAGLVGGCASRLPVAEEAPLAPADATRPAWSASAFQETVDRLGEREPCFLRCAAEHEAVSGEHEEEHFANEIAVFVGHTFERGEGGATIGLDYSRWLTRRFGVGAFVDFVLGDIDAIAAGAGVWVRPLRELEDLTFFVGPGVDFLYEEEEGHGHEGEGGDKREARALVRLGVLYGMDLGRGFRLVPAFYADVIFPDKRAFVLGMNFGKEF